jgi:hypothetical protein
MSARKKIALCVLALGTLCLALPAVAEAGRLGGPLVREGTAGPDDYDVYSARFVGGRVAEIRVQNAGTADLDLVIIDPRTLRVVAQDRRTASDARVRFTPPSTREYIIMVHNYTRNRSARYVLFTN